MGMFDDLKNLASQAAGTAINRAQNALDEIAHPDQGPPTGEALEKAEARKAAAGEGNLPPLKPEEDPTSLFWDPYSVLQQLGFREKPTSVNRQMLRAMTWRVPIISAIIQQRLHQISAFCTPQEDRYAMGYKVRLRDRKAKASRGSEKFVEEMHRVIQTTGVCDEPGERDDFEAFLRKIMWDSLVFDAACFEVVPDVKDRPSQWYAVDASTIMIADSSAYRPKEDDKEAARFVQVYDNTPIAVYERGQMVMGIRNPRTDIRLFGYGTSELELLISTVTAILWAWNYNSNFFNQGTVSKGLLNLKGTINRKQLRAFRRHWYQSLSGVENAWRTPILNANEGVEWHNMQNSNRDMEYSAWMDFLIKVACAMYSMDPMELGFQYGTGDRARPMFEGANKSRLVESRDRGLKPLLRFTQSMMNRQILWKIDEDFVFEFAGLNARTPEEDAKLSKERVSTTFTVNEIREERGDKPIEGGDIILNPVYIQGIQMKQQAEMAAQGMMPPGAEEAGQLPPGETPSGNEDEDDDGEVAAFLNQLSIFDEEDDEDETRKSLTPVGESMLFEVNL